MKVDFVVLAAGKEQEQSLTEALFLVNGKEPRKPQ